MSPDNWAISYVCSKCLASTVKDWSMRIYCYSKYKQKIPASPHYISCATCICKNFSSHLFVLSRVLTFTSTALSYQTNHQGCALIAFCWCVEGFHYKLVSFRLWNEQRRMLPPVTLLEYSYFFHRPECICACHKAACLCLLKWDLGQKKFLVTLPTVDNLKHPL